MSATTAFLTVAQAVRDVLLTAPALANGHVSLPLRRPVPPEWASAIEVRIGATDGETSFAGRAGPTRFTSTLVLEIYARGTDATTADDALDALLGAVHERLHTHTWDPALRILQLGLNPRIDWDWQQGDTPHAHASYQTTVLHDTTGADLSP